MGGRCRHQSLSSIDEVRPEAGLDSLARAVAPIEKCLSISRTRLSRLLTELFDVARDELFHEWADHGCPGTA